MVCVDGEVELGVSGIIRGIDMNLHVVSRAGKDRFLHWGFFGHGAEDRVI